MASESLYEGGKSIWTSIHENGDVRVTSEDGETEHCSSVTAAHKEELLARLLRRSPLRRTTDLPSLSPAHKDELVLKLIKEKFQGERNAVDMFYDFAKAEGLQPGYFRWP